MKRQSRARKPKPEQRWEYLTKGNDHIGESLFGFTIPALETCPGFTTICELICYALGFLFVVVNKNRDRHHTNWIKAKDAPAKFATTMIAEIRWKRAVIVRIHIGGDFFSVPYIHSWIRVANACRRVTFLFYTRSWRVPELVPALVELAALPNVYAWWSEDTASGRCDLPFGRRCFLVRNDAELALVPPGIELIFRHHPRTPLKWVGEAWVCPKEQALVERTERRGKQGYPVKVTCEVCKRCFVPGPMPRRTGAGWTEESPLFREAENGRPR